MYRVEYHIDRFLPGLCNIKRCSLYDTISEYVSAGHFQMFSAL